jgi:hypothetical protein
MRKWLANLALVALLTLPVACGVMDALHSFDPPGRPGVLVERHRNPIFPY